jgi:hypothetical protein
MTLSEDIGKIFRLDEAENRILSIMVQGKPNMTPYLVWKETRRLRKEIPQRTVYGKFRRLREGGYIVEVGKQPFKSAKVKRFFELTLKGMLAALADANVRLAAPLVGRLRKALHIQEEYEEDVSAAISIWARNQSEVPIADRGRIDAISIRTSVYKTLATWKALEIREQSVITVERARRSLSITDKEYEILTDYFIELTAFVAAKMDFEKRAPPFDSSIWPTPWFSDCIKIPPSFGVRLFWSISKYEEKEIASNYLSWLSMHKDIAAIISQGDEERLNQYLKELSSRLQFYWIPSCLRREHDGECTIKNTQCPYTSVLECGIIREKSKELEYVLNVLIEQKSSDRTRNSVR